GDVAARGHGWSRVCSARLHQRISILKGTRASWYDHRRVSDAVRTRADILRWPAASVDPGIVRPVGPAGRVCRVEPEEECVGTEDLLCVEKEGVVADSGPVARVYDQR